MRLWRLLSTLAIASSLVAQFGRTPPRPASRQQEKSPSEKNILVSGDVRELDAKSLLLEATDSRFLTFKLVAATKLPANLKVGDRVQVEGRQDSEAYLTAYAVILDKNPAARPRPISSTDSEPPSGSRRDAMHPQNAAANPPVDSPPPDDPNRPHLRYGKPKTRPAPVEEAESRTPDLVRPVTEAPPERPRAAALNPQLSPKQQLIESAREVALSFTESLPNYVCQQLTTRYIRTPGVSGWQAKDVVSAEVVYESGKENYKNIQINGKAINKRMEDLPGSWSTGEFGTTLRSLFAPQRQAEFQFVKQSQMAGLTTFVYDYAVKRENSDWRVQLGSQAIVPAYSGRVWIDTKSSRVLRIEMQAIDVPEEFPLDKVESASDYGFVRLATTDSYLLPTHAETLSCERGSSYCSRNTIDFRNYRKYTGDTKIIFDK